MEPRPWHLWLVGIVGLLWNLMGLLSFVLTQMKVEAVMSGFPPQQRAYFESFPWWAVGLWGAAVFSGVIGCVLLLMRHRLAADLLLASLVATIAFNLGGLFVLGGMDVMRDTGGLGFSMIPVIFAAFLAYYARTRRKPGT